MSVVVQTDMRFDLLQDGAKARWWTATQERARAVLMTESGTRIYVANRFDSLALSDRALAFLDVHVVSSATGSPHEFHRTVHVPPLRRLVPLARISSIAPIVDAEIGEQVSG